MLAKYVHTLLGRTHLDGEGNREHELIDQPHIHLTHYELFGLKEIVMYLYDLPPQRKNVPELIRDPVQLIKDVRCLVERHCKDSPEMAVTGKPVLHPDSNQSTNVQSQQLPENEHTGSDGKGSNNTNAGVGDDGRGDNGNGGGNGDDDASHIKEQKLNVNVDVKNDVDETKKFQAPKAIPSNKASNKSNKKNASDGTNGNERSNGNSSNAPRRRRRRCKVCVPCNSTECGQCAFCLDMVCIK